jgi:hypothetical protein
MPGKWHNNMEKLFPENMREVKFFCSSSDSNTCRRADILLNNNRSCEIQHSYISEEEIVKRFNDWNKFGKEIIWLVDGNNGIKLDKLSTGNYLLIFKDIWKYKSFLKIYEFILININDFIFKIELRKIKSGMIELKEPKDIEETINFLKTKPNQIWDFWSDDNTIKSILSVNQQGAGNGKTFGIWKSICENIDRKTYIIITKQHTAKTVIYEELKDQKNRFINGEDVFHIENIYNDTELNTEKHFVIKYTNKISKRECIVIIGTIDSFCYNLSHPNYNSSNFFNGIVNNISKNGATKINNGFMKYGGQYIQLSKESELWIDECQDLSVDYLHAMCKLMYETGCYINVVGDKLQSLEHSNNFLTSIVEEGLPNITININKPLNLNRRIKVTNMENEINKLINFKKYKLPEIVCDKTILKEKIQEPIKILDNLPIIYANEKSKDNITNYCNIIMDYYKYEVEKNNYLPNDFLIIFPIMKSNLIAPELESKIQEYWINKYNEKYTQYVYLHKHTEGTVINTNDSINATRIMSIRSSKGDGRKVVFILGITESSLKLISNNELGLIYESYLHVALTRAKNKIYFGLYNNNDHIHNLFSKSGYIEYLPIINKKLNLDKIYEYINKKKLIILLENNNINFNNVIDNIIKLNEPKNTVDWGYHCIKYQTYLYNVIYNINKNKLDNSTDTNSQLFVKLNIISQKEIVKKEVNEFWKFLDKYQWDDLPQIPLCNFSSKQNYTKHYDILHNTILKIKNIIIKNDLDKLNVYESIILTYLIELFTCQRYSNISPMDIYNITDFFHFYNENKEKELLNNIKNVRNIINKSGIKKYKNVNWNIFKHIRFDSEKDYFNINSSYNIIGNNETDIIHIVLISTISQLNFWDYMIKILLERFLIYNQSEKDYKRYKNKNIITYCFILDDSSYIKIKWNWDNDNLFANEIKNEILLSMEKYYQDNHTDIYNYFNYIKNNNIEKWDKKPDEIIDEILKSFNNKNKYFPDYIISVFEDIKTKIEDDEDYEYVNNFETFNKKLNKKLHIYLEKYLRL